MMRRFSRNSILIEEIASISEAANHLHMLCSPKPVDVTIYSRRGCIVLTWITGSAVLVSGIRTEQRRVGTYNDGLNENT